MCSASGRHDVVKRRYKTVMQTGHHSSMTTLLVTGTDTDVGKTWISCLILRSLRQHQLRVGAYKPACSGAIIAEDGERFWHDVEMLTEACAWQGDKQKICPQTFDAAVAPNIAAELEGRHINEQQLASGAKCWEDQADYLLVEGAGGLLCPLSNSKTVADVAVTLAAPIVIVTANKLGMINHTLLTVEVARQRSLHVAAIVVNNATETAADESQASNQRQLRHWLPNIPIVSCQYSATSLVDHVGETFDVRQLFKFPHRTNQQP